MIERDEICDALGLELDDGCYSIQLRSLWAVHVNGPVLTLLRALPLDSIPLELARRSGYLQGSFGRCFEVPYLCKRLELGI